ncbi:MAG: hypothetical protein AAF223_00965 [Bacteroidota bacterium]
MALPADYDYGSLTVGELLMLRDAHQARINSLRGLIYQTSGKIEEASTDHTPKFVYRWNPKQRFGRWLKKVIIDANGPNNNAIRYFQERKDKYVAEYEQSAKVIEAINQWIEIKQGHRYPSN